MFRSLLRTLPSLSGNISLSCIIDKSLIDKLSTNEYLVSIKDAELIPLQNSLYNKRIPVSLLTQNWEYNVATFYNTYSSIFFKNNYDLLTNGKEDYKIINLDDLDQISNRNKDYEYGCKRVKYLINNNQFSFYAPIYVDNINSLPDYFVINIKVNERYSKKIKIRIAKNDKRNYLGEYLKRYLNKIDDNVIFCLPYTSQATYYGISCLHGGFEQIKDNDFGKLYNYYTTINNFDYNICNGFERNKIIIRQIIPLAFRFNINDLLSENEIEHFRYYKFNISGYYENDYIKHDFYDFDIEYNNSYPIHRIYNPNTGGFTNNSDINVMDIGYPSLKESKLYEYRYSNKLSPHYCKWKLKHSTDDRPYIINLSYGYSYLNYPELKYGEFPTMFKDIHPHARIVNNSLKLPYGKYKDIYYEIDKVEDNIVYSNLININKYNKLIRNSYSSWFNIYDENHIFDDDNWVEVRDNEAYFKGVFYNLSKIYDKYPISKFAVFVNPITNYIDNNKFIKYSKFVVVNNEDDETKLVSNINYINEDNDMFITNNNDTIIKNDIYLKEDENGTFVEYNNYNEYNTYYKISDLLANGLSRKNDNGIILVNYDIISFELLNIRNNKNMFEDYYDNETGTFKERIFYREMFTEDTNNKYNPIKNRIYISNTYSTNKIKLEDAYLSFTSNEDVYGKYALYLSDTFIHKSKISNVFNLPKGVIDQDEILNKCQKYEYIPYNNDNGIELKNYFQKKTVIYPKETINTNELKEYINNFIFVDPENLEKYIDVIYENDIENSYNKASENTTINENIEDKIEDIKVILKNQTRYKYYCKFIDKNHIKEYYKKLIEKYGKSVNLLSYISNRKRILQVDIDNTNIDNEKNKSDIIIKDSYIELDKLFDFYNDDNIVTNIETTNIDFFFDSLSDNRTVNNKFSLVVTKPNEETINVYLDLCYEKEFILLNNIIRDNIIFKDKENDSLYNYLYLYKLEDTNDDNYDIFYKYGYESKYNSFYNQFKLKDTIDYMVPLFTNIYLNDEDRKLEYNILKDNCYPCTIKNSKTKRLIEIYSINNKIDCFYEINNYKENENGELEPYIDDIAVKNCKKYSIYNVLDMEINNNITINYIKDNIFDVNNDEQNKAIFEKSLVEFAIYKKIPTTEELNTYIHENLNEYIDFLGSEYAEVLDLNNSLSETSKKYFYDKISIANKKLIYKDYETKINIYEYNGEYYGAYVLDINLDNTNMSMFTTYDDIINFIYFDSINKYKFYHYDDNGNKIIDEQSFNKVIKEVFWRIYPFVKVNLFTYLVKELNDIVVLPTEFNLKTNKYPIKYDNSNKDTLSIKNNISNNIEEKTIILKNTDIESKKHDNFISDNIKQMLEESYDKSTLKIKFAYVANDVIVNEIDLFRFVDIYKKKLYFDEYYAEVSENIEQPEYYTLKNIDEDKNIKLIRYFNRIIPYMKKTSKILDYTCIKLKENTNYIDSNIIYKENIYINRCNPIRIYMESKKYKELYQYEYKHFNDNSFFNFEEKFELKIENKIFSDIEIKKYRVLETTVSDDEYSPYYMFSEYIKKLTNNRPDIRKCMLFLFNNYKIKYNVKFYEMKNKIKYYTMSYEFTLK